MKELKINIGIRLPTSLVKRLKEKAIAEHRSTSGQAEQILHDALPSITEALPPTGEKIEHHPKKPETSWTGY